MTVFGWDASDFDWSRGPMDLAAARADGISWFTHKATEATNTRHVHLREALDRARAAGIEFLGAYHVVRSSPSPQAQVGYFLGYLDQQVPWWRTFPGFLLQVDLELWPYDQVSAATGIAFAHALEAGPKRVITYASRGMYGNSLAGVGTPLWNANYGKGNPVAHYRDVYPGDGGDGWAAYSGQTPVMWQYGSRLTIGSQPGCDANAFRGSLADLRQLITGGDPGQVFPGGNTPHEESDMPMYLLKTPTGHQYRGDGLWYAPIMTGAELDGWLNLVPPERRFEGVNLEWWGRDVTAAPAGTGAGPTLAQIQTAAGAAIDGRLPAIADAVVDEDHRRSAD